MILAGGEGHLLRHEGHPVAAVPHDIELVALTVLVALAASHATAQTRSVSRSVQAGRTSS